MVGGQVEPDSCVLNKCGALAAQAHIGKKSHKIVCGPDGKDQRTMLAAEERERRVLRDEELSRLRELGVRIEQHYGAPQDIEWATEGGAFYIVQSRSITTG